MTLATPRKAGTVDAGHPQSALQRLGLRTPPSPAPFGTAITNAITTWQTTLAKVVTTIETQLRTLHANDPGWRP